MVFKSAHPNSKTLLNEDFYWSPIEESGPFGSDAGSDAFAAFKKWRKKNANSNPLVFIDTLLNKSDLPKFDRNELDPNKIREFISAGNETTKADKEIWIQECIEELRQYNKNAGRHFDEKEARKWLTTGGKSNINNRSDSIIVHDNKIIAVGFGQFVLEGKMDNELKTLVNIAIQRQLLSDLLENFSSPHIDTRMEQLNKMLKVLENIPD